jgi:nitroreductase
VTRFFDGLYRPKEGDRQPLHFTFSTLRKYRRHRKEALAASAADGGKYLNLAFFGTHDHYRRSGVVSVRSWRRLFGKDSYLIYDGTHFMEEEFLRSMLIPAVREFFQGKP